jgi:S-adenosylmethionine:tRNA ribosyltransferase-isomerase
VTLSFTVPDELSARAPAEARGLARDDVRLLVASPNEMRHAQFVDLPRFLNAGDLVVVNTSATLPAAVAAQRANGTAVTVHFSTRWDDGSWLAELRPPIRPTGPVTDGRRGEQVMLPHNVRMTLLEPHGRLWRVRVDLEGELSAYLARVGRPISYLYVPGRWPLSDYQTVFAHDPGSAEMPSAARPFTTGLVTRLVTAGVVIAPITLHAGVSSLDVGEPPLPERYRMPTTTARLVNLVRAAGGRIVAIGTTVTRALESAVNRDGAVRAADGWTDLVLGLDRPAHVVDGLVTGWHAPGASHLRLLEAVAGTELVAAAYREAIRTRYLWHEFGDSCLLLPDRQDRPQHAAG